MRHHHRSFLARFYIVVPLFLPKSNTCNSDTLTDGCEREKMLLFLLVENGRRRLVLRIMCHSNTDPIAFPSGTHNNTTSPRIVRTLSLCDAFCFFFIVAKIWECVYYTLLKRVDDARILVVDV